MTVGGDQIAAPGDPALPDVEVDQTRTSQDVESREPATALSPRRADARAMHLVDQVRDEGRPAGLV